MKKKHMTAKYVWETYGRNESLAVNTYKATQELDMHMRRWDAFSKSMPIRKIERHHMEAWRRSLLDENYSVRTANKHLGSLRRALVIAEDHGIIKRRPKLPCLPEFSNSATKLYYRDEQIDALFETASQMKYPEGDIPPEVFWRVALILYRTYGFRPQELLTYEHVKAPLTWDAFDFNTESPDIDSHEKCVYGWLSYTPPKTKKKKPSPITIPLTVYARGALNALSQYPKKSAVLPIPKNSEKFFRAWHGWIEIAGVKAKQEDLRMTPKHLRKTAATYHNQNKPGLASAVCRWGTSAEAAVASNHYISNDLLLRDIHTTPMPSSFEWALNFVHVSDDPSMLLS